ncbi:uncharacterized protein [Sinocyclocheilus grahami]|uniref:uncharacterized protein n=1 Tax=Sinocyclocheilus grahami TaxID=75366 RepID=UPI0007AC9774|nr:PREDICTED: uncharacterized protein LOC107573119 [Sinocyclocheilus grahami]
MIVLFNFAYLKMQLLNCVLLLMQLMIADGLIVRSPAGPLVAPLGSSVILPCYVDELLLMEGLEVEWRRTDSQTLVHLYQDGESRPEAQQQEYHDRAHFFTDQIQHGNFSLRLDNLTAEDEGRYTCRVYSQQDSGETEVQIKDAEHLLVSGSDKSVSAYDGEDVTLSCSVDSHITPGHIEEVSWKKTDGNILVLLYQNNETFPDSSDEQYRDRVEFFTAEIPKGNFSLRLKSVRTEDKGVYMCLVFAGGLSANATVVLEVGFSTLQIIMLIFCITASGSALLLFCLIYCTSHNNDVKVGLHLFLVFCPNILMFLAFVLWGVSEGSLFESVSCCALYFLRPLMVLWAAPYVHKFTGNNKTWILKYSFRAEYIVFSAVFYSVLFKYTWDKSISYTGFESIVIPVLFVIVLLLNLLYIIYLLARFINKLSEWIITIFGVLVGISFNILPAFQFILLFFTFGSGRGGILIVTILPVLLTATRYDWGRTCGEKMNCSPLFMRTAWLILMLVVNAGMVFFYIIALENEKDRIAWVCMIAFLQVLWAVINFTRSFDFALHRVVPVYVFGSVVVVVLNSVTLMIELILNTVNGDRSVGDLRIVVFSSEGLFALSLLSLQVFEPWMRTCLQSRQKAAGSDDAPANESNQKQNTAESHEMNSLLNQDQDAGRTEETQPDSVETQISPTSREKDSLSH